MRKKFTAFVLSLTLFICIYSGTAAFADDAFVKVGLAKENAVYSVDIEQQNYKLKLQKTEKSILDDNIRVTIVDTDDDGKTIFRHWTPSDSDIEEAENVYVDESSKATFRISEDEKIAGIIDGKPILYSDEGYKFGETNIQRSDYIDLGRNMTKARQAISSVKAIVETVIVCDKEFGDAFNHNYQNILNYWVVYMWDVNMRYKSLPSNDISFQVNGIVVISSSGAQPFIENARGPDGRAEFGRILNLYTSWAYEQRGNLPPHDMAPLVTNTRLEWGGGLAWMNGPCWLDHTNRRSLGTLVFNDGGNWGSLTVGAHEMGHNVGAPHDDDPNFPGGCSERGFIMGGGNDDLRYFFSSCSDRTISNFVRSDSASCLRTLSSNNPILHPSFDNPKAPSLLAQCRKNINDPQAWVEDKDPSTCKTKICWRRLPDNSITGIYFVPVDNSECSNGGRCFRGACRLQGQFFKNIGSGLCIQASNPFNSGAAFIMVQCPSPGTPLDRLLVKQGNSGSMLASPFIMGTEAGERCGYTGNAEGNIIWTDRCSVDNPWHGWDFQDVGNNQFLLKHRVSGRCAKPQSNNVGSSIGTYGACNSNDNNMKWQRY